MNSDLALVMDWFPTPGSELAEKSVIGAVLSEPGALLVAARMIRTSEAFWAGPHRLIWNAILGLTAENTPADVVTVSRRLRQDGTFDAAGGTAALLELRRFGASPFALETHCQLVLEEFIKRRISAHAERLQTAARDGATPAFDLLNQARRDLDAVVAGSSLGREVTMDDECEGLLADLTAAHDSPQSVTVPWHLPELDGITGGIFSPSADFIIVAGAAGCGKTALFVHVAKENGKAGNAVGVFSLEMPARDLVRRMVASELGGLYTNSELRRGQTFSGPVSTDAVRAAAESLRAAPVHVCDEGGLDIARLALKALEMKQRHGVRLILIDYLQLIGDESVRGGSDTARISSVSRKLKALAKLLNVPVLAISNLTKEAVKSEDKRPHKEHLRESGQIEYDADSIIMMYRPEYHGITSLPEGTRYPAAHDTRYLIQAQVEKNRNGPCNTVNLWCDVATNRFFPFQPPASTSDFGYTNRFPQTNRDSF